MHTDSKTLEGITVVIFLVDSFSWNNIFIWIAQTVRDNWLTGTCTINLKTNYRRKKSNNLHILFWSAEYIQLSNKNNFIGFGTDGRLQSWNRWTLECEVVRNLLISSVLRWNAWKLWFNYMILFVFLKVFDDPFLTMQKLKPKLETIHLNDTVVVGEFTNKFMCIWSLVTRKVVCILFTIIAS